MKLGGVRFSIVSDAAWAPGLDTAAAWLTWANDPYVIAGSGEAAVSAMPAMLRRRAGAMGKMALEAAYRCLDGKAGVPTVFCSRHGECVRSVELLADLAQGQPLSPTSFSLSVHNAAAGLFSIARQDQASHAALAAGHSGVEHAVIEACGLLADGAAEVLLVVYDGFLPEIFEEFQDCQEQPFAWAWLIRSAQPTELAGTELRNTGSTISLSWSGQAGVEMDATEQEPASGRQSAGLEVLAFYLRQDSELIRMVDGRRWCWRRLA
ncbi:Beta-ketoacyl synthase, N-terminal domain [Collimonas sp. OK607]|uniref:beta-ketoacyl synthase chain length factor n=1 Tax=Collimonas sp. OK607 TaxID=1798194 RepID=UPI0008EA164B|nr:beta-ketoacyl synthase chain length factor [Collimonas sp. OK607]SFA70465.1 Beta-ketoacyl synthase, N-terminal domain [Collimonas sp. OK607]